MLHLFRTPGDESGSRIIEKIMSVIPFIEKIEYENCFNIGLTSNSSSCGLNKELHERLRWLLSETYCPENTREESFLNISRHDGTQLILEVGPRLAFSTGWSSNAVSMCHACEINCVSRIERSRRYLITSTAVLSSRDMALLESLSHDRMTEMVYRTPLLSFESSDSPEPVRYVPVMAQGKAALATISKEKGLGFDEWDLEYYTQLFRQTLRRDPSDVEVTLQLCYGLV